MPSSASLLLIGLLGSAPRTPFRARPRQRPVAGQLEGAAEEKCRCCCWHCWAAVPSATFRLHRQPALTTPTRGQPPHFRFALQQQTALRMQRCATHLQQRQRLAPMPLATRCPPATKLGSPAGGCGRRGARSACRSGWRRWMPWRWLLLLHRQRIRIGTRRRHQRSRSVLRLGWRRVPPGWLRRHLQRTRLRSLRCSAPAVLARRLLPPAQLPARLALGNATLTLAASRATQLRRPTVLGLRLVQAAAAAMQGGGGGCCQVSCWHWC